MTTGTSPRKAILADIGLLYAAAIWGSTFYLVKNALSGIDPVTMVAYRFLLAGVLMLAFLAATRRPILRGLGPSALLAVILWTLYTSQTIGLGITSASNSGFITGLFVAFIPLFLRTIFRRKPTIMELVASGVSLLGLWILTGGMSEFNLGDALTLITAMAYALHLLYADKYIKQGIDPYTITCQQFLIVGMLSLITSVILGLPLTIGSTGVAGTVVFLALFPTLSAFLIQMLAQKIRSPLRVSLIFALEPLFAALFAWTLGGEQFVLRGAIGGLFIAVALAISGLPSRPIK
jgi:drug/metabolite transporter (DMT)-like permease